jgi:hypothetical protein
MSFISTIGAVCTAVHDAERAAESAVLSAVQPALDSVRDAAGPVVADALGQVANHPQLFGSEVSGIAGLLAETCGSEPRGPLQSPWRWLSTVTPPR